MMNEKQVENRKKYLGAIGVILLIGACVAVVLASQKGGRESEAISMVQSYGQDVGGKETILTCLSSVFQVTESTGTPIERLGWYADCVSGDVYHVGFAFKEWDTQMYVEWEADLGSNGVTGLDEMARTVKELALMW